MRPLALALLVSCSVDGPPLAGRAAARTLVDEPPNVLIVVIDDVGIDKVRSYSPGAPSLAPQPTLDRLADEGIRFEHAYASTVCSPTRAALLTGRHGRRYGIGWWLPPGSPVELPVSEITIAEMLHHGPVQWTTGAFGKWHVGDEGGPSGRLHPLYQGFRTFSGALNNLRAAPDAYYDWTKVIDGRPTRSTTYATTDNVDDALHFTEVAPEPWLAWVAFNAVHTPLHRPPDDLHSYDERGIDDRFDHHGAVLEAMDTELGRLLDGLEPDLRARTVVMVVGDNGTAGPSMEAPYDPSRGKGTVMEHGVRVPLLVTGPVVGVAGSVSEALVHVVDVFPTVAELAGVDVTASPLDRKALDGHSLLAMLADPTDPGPREYLYAERFQGFGPPPYVTDHRTVRDHDYKLVAKRDPYGPERTALFDLHADPIDEGEAIEPGTFDAVEQAAYDALLAELARIGAEVRYDPALLP